MSADDPTDDELEREAIRDIPAHIGSARHAPKLSAESRAINPRAFLAEERAAHNPPQASPSTFYEGRSEPMQRRPALVPPRPTPSIAAGLGQLPYRSPAPPVPPPPAVPDVLAWDQYVRAALPLVVGLVDNPEEIAAQLADRLLEERRRRFG